MSPANKQVSNRKSSQRRKQADPRLKILLANGVNLDLLGRREPHIYGKSTLADIERELRQALPFFCEMLALPEVALHAMQTNDEAVLLDILGEGWDGVVINAGAWTHTSLALADRLQGLKLPFVEVHLSNLHAREAFRQHSFLAPHAVGVVSGLGVGSYLAGALGLLHKLAKR